MSNIKNKVKSGLAWSGIAKLISQLLSWASTFVVIRYLEPSDYGVVGIAFALIGFFAILSEFGLADALIQKKYISLKNTSQVFTVTFLFNCSIFISLFFLSPTIASYYNHDALSAVVIFVAANLLLSSFIVIPESLMNKEMLFKKRAIIETIASLINTGIALTLAFFGFGYWAILIGQAVNTLIRVILFNVFGESNYSLIFDFKGFKKLFNFGFFIFCSRLVWAMYNRLDVFVIGRIFGTHLLGVYTVALQIASMPLDKISGTINQVAFSAFSKNKLTSDNIENFLSSIRLLAFITCPIFFGIAAISPQLIPLLIGDKWVDSIILVQLLTLIMPFKLIASFLDTYIASKGDALLNFKITCFYLAFISVGLVIGGLSDIQGLVISLNIYYLLCFFFMLIRICQRIEVIYLCVVKSFGIPILSSLFMWLSINFFTNNIMIINSIVMIILNILLGALFYFLFMYFISPRHINEFREAIKKA